MIGTRIAHYEIRAHLGSGGMGDVYQASDTKLNREVAIKVLPEIFADDAGRMARFGREAKVLASLNHPNIAHIYGVEERALVMELAEGESPKGPMPFDDAWKIALQIADALEYAHEQGVVHRDLKPANIKVTPDGVVKLLDFGLAKAFSDTPETAGNDPSNSPTLTLGGTVAGIIMGTAAYMAPEQAKGKRVDKRADIWSWGVVLYELLTGEQLFKGEDAADTLAHVLTQQPNLDKAPTQVRELLRRCLERDPKQRLRDIGDAQFLLEQVGDKAYVQGAAPSTKFAWTAACVLAIVAMAVSFVHFRERPAQQPLTSFRVELGPDAVAGQRMTVAISPDGRRLAFVAGSKEQLFTRALEQASPTLLSGTERASDMFFSPDSQWIGFFADGAMKKVPVTGGAAVTLCNAPNARGASWGQDGNIIVTLNSLSGTGLSLVRDSGGTPQTLTNPADTGDASHRWPQILPGGEAVLFSASPVAGDYNNASIKVLTVKTGQIKVVARGGYFGRYIPLSDKDGELIYVNQGTLFGVPFNLQRLEPTGTVTPLLEDLASDTATGGGQFDFSRNGTFIYLNGKSAAQSWPLVWLDSSGKKQPLLETPGMYFSPRLSPNGKRLAYSLAFNQIQIYDIERAATINLTFNDQRVANAFPVWTPDGKHLVFRAQSSPSVFSLLWTRSDGAGTPQSLMESKTELRPYSFSPDGTRLAFAGGDSKNGLDLWTMPLDLADPEHPKAGKPELFLDTRFDEYEPAFSPDGRWIAYRSTSSGVSEVYVQPFPGPGGKWLIGTGRHPIWSRNAGELFYYSNDNNRVMVATYRVNGDSFVPDRARVWSDARIMEPNIVMWNMDLAPDGKRAVVSERNVQTGPVQVTVLLNFFDELRSRATATKR
jgi:serine/threonine-protein kinase